MTVRRRHPATNRRERGACARNRDPAESGLRARRGERANIAPAREPLQGGTHMIGRPTTSGRLALIPSVLLLGALFGTTTGEGCGTNTTKSTDPGSALGAAAMVFLDPSDF